MKKEIKNRVIEIVEDNENWLWRSIKNIMLILKKGDELGFMWKRRHWVIRKGEFSKKVGQK